MRTKSFPTSPWATNLARRLARAGWCLCFFLCMLDCANLRLHNKARAAIAEEAAKLAGEIRASESNPFVTMETNMEAAHQQNLKAYELTRQLYFELFKEGFPQMDRDQLREEIGNVWDDHLNTNTELDRTMNEVAKAVDLELSRQKLISKSLNEAPSVDLASALAKVNQRLKWLEDLSDFVNRAKTDFGGGKAGTESASDQPDAFRSTLTHIDNLFEKSLSADGVKRAQALKERLSQEVLQFEARRMLEYQRFLSEVESLRRSFEFYNADFMNKLMFPVLKQINVPKYKEICKDFPEPAGGAGGPDGASAMVDCERDDELLNCQEEINNDLWAAKTTVSDYVTRVLGDGFELPQCLREMLGDDARLIARVTANRRGQALEMIGAVGILVFVENPRDLQTLQELALSRHRHSIKLSQINADYRMALVEKVAQSNQIYYAGGIKPEEIAEMILLTTHLAAISAIATD